MKHILTEREMLYSLNQNVSFLCNSVRKNLYTLKEIADEIPCHLHLNRKRDMAIYFINKVGRDYYGDYFETILENGAEAMQNIIHPHSTQEIMEPLIELAASDDAGKIFSFVQFVRRDPNSPYQCFITNTKLYEPDDSLISITLQVSCLDKFSKQMMQMLEQDQFYTSHYPRFQILTRREKEILGYIADGKTNQDIADLLCISKFTVKTHRQNILSKLETSRLADLIKYAQTFL
ncbi:MAG: LuxR C-terminal-related transcriptional regulator [candidate division KSB1 bacterium]|nr:LuxR C-terminal-related transcriptional regulator [candidate division KSB1 bacterium]